VQTVAAFLHGLIFRTWNKCLENHAGHGDMNHTARSLVRSGNCVKKQVSANKLFCTSVSVAR